MFANLIKEFKTVTRSHHQNDETFFEICGFPHYENVISNVLAFFFNGQNSHNLKGLFLKSLLESAGIENEDIGLQFQAEREVRTERGGYIDILLHNETACIVIENKIFSGLHNDLEDYIEYGNSKNKEYVYGILLSISETDPRNVNFKNITYSNFINKLRDNLGSFIDRNYNKYIFLLMDLINNIETLQKGSISMNSEFVTFIRENHDEVQRLGAEIKTYHDDLRRIVKEVNSYVIEEVKNIELKQMAWRELPELYDIAVSDFQLDNGIGIALDSVINPNEWKFEIFARTNPGINFQIKDFCVNQGLDGYLEGNRFILHETMQIEAKPKDVANKIANIIRQMVAQQIN